MAELIDFKVGEYVKWNVKNGVAVGQIFELGEKIKIKTPSDYIVESDELENLAIASELEFESAVDDLIEKISKKSRKARGESKAKEETMTDCEKTQAELAEAANKVLALEAQLAAANEMVAQKSTACDAFAKEKEALQAEFQALKAKCDEFMKEKAAQARLISLKEVDGVDLIAASETDALASLVSMSQEVFDNTIKMAKAAQTKLKSAVASVVVEVPITEKPEAVAEKPSDEAVAEEVLNNVKKEDEVTLAAAAIAEQDSIKTVSAIISKSLKKEKKVTKNK